MVEKIHTSEKLWLNIVQTWLVNTVLECLLGLYRTMNTGRIRTKVEIVRICGSHSIPNTTHYLSTNY